MKVVLSIFTVLTVISYIACTNVPKNPTTAGQYMAKTINVWANCKVDLKLTDAEYVRMTTKPTFPTTKNEKCFKLCFAKGMGMMTANGEVNARAVKEGNRLTFGKDPNVVTLANKVFEQCDRELKSSRQTDLCEKAAAFSICMMKGMQKQSQHSQQRPQRQ